MALEVATTSTAEVARALAMTLYAQVALAEMGLGAGSVATTAVVADVSGRAKVDVDMAVVESTLPEAVSDDDESEDFIVFEASDFASELVVPGRLLEGDAGKEDAAFRSVSAAVARTVELELGSSSDEETEGPYVFEAPTGVAESEVDAEVVSVPSSQTTGEKLFLERVGDSFDSLSLSGKWSRFEGRVNSSVDYLSEKLEAADRATDRRVERFCEWGDEKIAKPWNAKVGRPMAVRQKRLEDFINGKSEEICTKSRAVAIRSRVASQAMAKSAGERAERMQQAFEATQQVAENRINGGVSGVAHRSKAVARAARKGIEAAAKKGFSPLLRKKGACAGGGA